MLMYYAFTPDPVFKSVLPNGSEPTCQTIMLYSDTVPLIYVNKTVWQSAFLQDSSRSFYDPGWLLWCQDYPKRHLMDEGPGAILF